MDEGSLPSALPCGEIIFDTNGNRLGGVGMKLYRINKLAKAGGAIIKKKHILARSDSDAVQQASDSADCPICDVLRDGEQVGSIV